MEMWVLGGAGRGWVWMSDGMGGLRDWESVRRRWEV